MDTPYIVGTGKVRLVQPLPVIVFKAETPSPGCAHHYCGNSWVTIGSTTGGEPGGRMAWGICCKCGARSEPARSYEA